MTLEPASPAVAVERMKTFVNQHALPLWDSSGFDDVSRCFHERLSFSGMAPTEVPRRLMVQCRQIASLARSAVCGWYKEGERHAALAFETACRRYHAPDGNQGWVFSLRPDGEVEDATRDLYAHSFVLYMLAWMHRLTADPGIIRIADGTILEIDRIFTVSGEPGLISRVPGRTDIREQNPHMHLLEALLALAETTGAERYLNRAASCLELFDNVLADSESGSVRELFDSSWRPLKSARHNLVEPGHQMEWAWLLREWQRLSGVNVDERVRRLVEHATTFGIDSDRGWVYGSVLEGGEIVSKATRVWSQTETIRALCREDPAGVTWPGLVTGIVENLFRLFLPRHLNGGWIDQIDENGQPAIGFMPASTLYHLVGASIDAEIACSGSIDNRSLRTSTGSIRRAT